MDITRVGRLHTPRTPVQYIGCKPAGGLWFSPGSEWIDKCMEDYPGELDRPITTCTLKEKANIFKVDSREELLKLEAEYGIEVDEYEYTLPVGLDWERFLSDWDGLWVTEKALTDPDNFQEDKLTLYAWDVESIVLFREVWHKTIHNIYK